jgi:drug/metabolite transporter (DMT)-like permease
MLRSRSALFLVPTFIWGTTWLAIKHQLGVVPPEVSVAWRFALAAVVLLGIAALRGDRLRLGLREQLGCALLGLLLFGPHYVLVYRSEQVLASGLVAVLFATMVFWTLLGARLAFGAAIPRAVGAGAVLGVLGVALLFGPELAGLGRGEGTAEGIALAVVGTVIASAGSLWSQRLFSRGLAVLPGTGVAMAWGSALLLAWCAARGIPLRFDPRPPYVLSLLHLALLGSVVAFVAYGTLIQRVGAGPAGYTAAVIPVVAMIVSTLFEGYRWSPASAAGVALVLCGTVLVLRAKAETRGSGPTA